jgi:flagellar hook-associated protein 1
MSTPGTFFGLNIGLSGLQAAQYSQDVTGNNISNAGTPGYTNETAIATEGPSYAMPSADNIVEPGQLGSGAVVNTVSRSRSIYIDAEFRSAQSQSSSDTALSTSLGNVQNSFGEPSTTGINAAISTFFNSIDDLQNSPSDPGVRSTVIDDASGLAQTIQTVQSGLTSNATQISANITSDMSEVNSIGQQIASLNGQIRAATAQNDQPNSLLDQRDLLVDNLSKLVNVTTSNNMDGTQDISIGSSSLVVGTSSYAVDLPTLQSRGDLTSGEVSGLTQAQTNLAGYQSNLNNVASTIITQVNQVQESGMGLDGSTGVAFFTGTNAATIAVNSTLSANPDELAAAAVVAPPATTPPPSDASNAVLMGNIATTAQANLGNLTIAGYYGGVISNLGGVTQASQTAETDSSAVLTQFTNERASDEGVSTDNQMTNMMEYQRSYQAAAQYISTQDDMLNTLVNTMFGS